jgi:hypothetical protein
MPLQVFTAHYSIKDPDRLDITLQGAMRGADRGESTGGEIFAPSPRLLWPTLAHIQIAEGLTRRAAILPRSEGTAWMDAESDRIVRRVGEFYETTYREEMRSSCKANRDTWNALLDQKRIVLVCFCRRRTPGDEQIHTCHRHLLTGYLVKLGAVDAGEIELDLNPVKPPMLDRYVAVTGTRPPEDPTPAQRAHFDRILADVASQIRQLPRGTILLHGGARGIDTAAERIARGRGFQTISFPPFYDLFGNEAPLVRNAYVAMAPKLLAWTAPWSRGGTRKAMRLAKMTCVEIEERRVPAA